MEKKENLIICETVNVIVKIGSLEEWSDFTLILSISVRRLLCHFDKSPVFRASSSSCIALLSWV